MRSTTPRACITSPRAMTSISLPDGAERCVSPNCSRPPETWSGCAWLSSMVRTPSISPERASVCAPLRGISPRRSCRSCRLCPCTRCACACHGQHHAARGRASRAPGTPAPAERQRVDALIIADLGVFRMAQREAPNCELHISTQVSIANAACAAAWHELGAKRVVLARELSLEEIRVIRRDTPPELELETFAHGAMCVSYSGRCLPVQLYDGPRQQPRRMRAALPLSVCPHGGKAPRRVFPRVEDESTYIMNSRDMCMIDHLAELAEAAWTASRSRAAPNRLLCCHHHRGLPPRARCRRRRGAGRPGLAR